MTRLEPLLETANSLSCSRSCFAVAVTVVAASTTTVAAAVVVADVERASGSTVAICFDCEFAVAVDVVPW